MQFWVKIWDIKAARPALLALGLIVLVAFLWGLTALLGKEAPKPKVQAGVVDVVVKGRVPNAVKLDPDQGPLTVHVSVPELAYQTDVVVKPGSDGTFEAPIQLQTEETNLHYSVDVSLGDQRWNAIPPQRLVVATAQGAEIAVPDLAVDPPAEHQDLGAHLDSKPKDTTLSENRRQRRQERMERREQRQERLRQRREARPGGGRPQGGRQ